MDPDSPTGHRSMPSIDLAQLDRYLAGELPPTEARAFRRVLATRPELAVLAHELRTLTPTASGTIATDRAEGRALIAARLAATAPHAAPDAPPAPTPRPLARVTQLWPRGVGSDASRQRLLAAIGATFVMGTALSVLVVTMWTRGRAGSATSLPMREYATAAGQRLTVTMKDGTAISLAPASRVRVPMTFDAGTRTVSLEGEALFVVAHDAEHPFRVRTRTTEIEDIGTRFDVRAYRDDEVTARVVVVEGAVAVSSTPGARNDAAPSVTLQAGDVAVLDGDGHSTLEHGVDVRDYLAWADGQLVFVKTPFAEAARDIGRRYDLDVRVADPALAVRRVTASFIGDSLDAVLSVLAVTLDARVERHGRVITFTTRRGAR